MTTVFELAPAKDKPTLSDFSAEVLRALHPVDPDDPFKIEGPTLISMSGGRTSARLLRLILLRHAGRLPDGAEVFFANTGLEREETLTFVRRIEEEWRVPIRWLEWRPRLERPGQLVPSREERFEWVGHNSASRRGEPFEEMISRKMYLPNKVTRYCTAELKVKTMIRAMASLGHARWTNVIGLRRDEPARFLRQIIRNDSGKERYVSVMPLYTAGVTVREITEYWKRARFDLGLRPDEGNCTLCFLKGEKKLSRLIRDDPASADWWARMERDCPTLSLEAGGGGNAAFFSTRFSYEGLRRAVLAQPMLFEELPDEDDGECGDACGVELEEDDA